MLLGIFLHKLLGGNGGRLDGAADARGNTHIHQVVSCRHKGPKGGEKALGVDERGLDHGPMTQTLVVAVTVEAVGVLGGQGKLTVHLIGKGNDMDIQFMELPLGQITSGIGEQYKGHIVHLLKSFLILYYSIFYAQSRGDEIYFIHFVTFYTFIFALSKIN
jgi:hypothetical protein